MSHIRRLSQADMPQLLDLEEKCFDHPWDSTRFLLGLEMNLFSVYGLEFNQRLAAYLSIAVSRQEMQILKLAVQDSHRRQGLASRLLKFAEFLAKKLQLKKITLEVDAGNKAALSLYRKTGYLAIQKKDNYYPGKNSTALIMAKQIGPEHDERGQGN